MKDKEKYIDKAECIKRGFVRKAGGIYKMSVLEKYARKGWLNLGDEKYSGADRMKAAGRLQKDYEMSCFMSVAASSNREKVDSQGKAVNEVDAICKARKRYFAAAAEVPAEFWHVLKSICLENREVLVSGTLSGRRKLEESYLLKRDLCRGLDRLIKFYWAV